MSGPFRLPTGGAIDRSRSLRFTFDGRPLSGFAGDTLASALLGAGVRVVGRSFKFHRPRGILSAGVEEPNALLTVGHGKRRDINVRATLEPLADALRLESQNRWPALNFDLGRINDALHPLLAAGFYNKTFLWPSWHWFEPAIRRMAGLARAPEGPDPDRYAWRNHHCDVLVVGAGPSGLLAATLAARAGARVLVLERDRVPGGSWNWQGQAARGPQPSDRIAAAAIGLARSDNVRLLLNTTAVAMYDHGVVTAVEKCADPPVSAEQRTGTAQRWLRIRARQIVLATGAIEQPQAFPYNDRPGIFLAGAAQHYLHRYGVAVGRRVVVTTNNDSAYSVAADLARAGLTVRALLDTRLAPDAELTASMRLHGIQVHTQVAITGTTGRSLDGIRFTSAETGPRIEHLECDALAMSGGWNPVAHLYCQAGGRLHHDERQACLVPDGQLESVLAVGAASARFELSSALEHTRSVIPAALTRLGKPPRDENLPQWAQAGVARTAAAVGPLGYTGERLRSRTWIDFQHDVTAADIELAVRENLLSVEHVKRYTTVGMALDQGKTSNLNAMAVLGAQSGRTLAEVGTTTFRPPFIPVTLGAIAGGRNGDFYKPRRLLAAHETHASLGARFEEYGAWTRPACYPRAGESAAQACLREMRTVRAQAGLFDGSPLGKFLVRGPDAAPFLDRIYANTMSTLEPGRVRYGIMLSERGILIDDGVCARLGPEEFLVNTSSGGAARIGAWLEEWLQGHWSDLRVLVTDVTSEWATFAVAGPNARQILSALDCDIDLGREVFPHMQVRAGRLLGLPCRILRVSFTGELTYEISVPADHASPLWRALLSAGEPHGLCAYGVEALLVMRIEKGYLHVGGDTDGTTVPDDVGFGPALGKKTSDFIGRRSLRLAEHIRPDRMQLVGLSCTGDPAAFTAGAHLMPADPQSDTRDARSLTVSQGYLTSACYSPSLDRHVGLGMLVNGRARHGESIRIVQLDGQTRATVVTPTHLDPTGERLRG
ncbi:MAG TPA: sarcosine oxidase subunit alpha family protein [Steroidobacteraceae bacterium]|nr:sarcosine oxidase subunit alpha family protein [Steroidobacteraceae bacterium]